ncbi:MAG: hypothetical protein QNK03_22240, partial [Myxococcota bacterium]|nr:hypothetical protein [Myxococcota bacterium]
PAAGRPAPTAPFARGDARRAAVRVARPPVAPEPPARPAPAQQESQPARAVQPLAPVPQPIPGPLHPPVRDSAPAPVQSAAREREMRAPARAERFEPIGAPDPRRRAAPAPPAPAFARERLREERFPPLPTHHEPTDADASAYGPGRRAELAREQRGRRWSG